MRACPERTTLHGSTRCEENPEEYRGDVDRFLRILGLLLRHKPGSSCFLHLAHLKLRANLLAGSERSVLSSAAAGVDTTSLLAAHLAGWLA